jgi:hypothetical protein
MKPQTNNVGWCYSDPEWSSEPLPVWPILAAGALVVFLAGLVGCFILWPAWRLELVAGAMVLLLVVCVALACIDRMPLDDSILPRRYCMEHHEEYYAAEESCPRCERRCA